MKKTLLALFFAVLLLCSSGVNFAISAISSQDIYISEPMNFTIAEGSSSFLAANIKNFSAESPLYITISKKNKFIDDEFIKENSPVTQLKLTAPDCTSVAEGVSCPMTYVKNNEYSAERIREIIQNYFSLKEQLSCFEEDSEVLNLTKEQELELWENYEVYQTKYMFLFEEIVFEDIVESPSYYTDLSEFEVGEYIVRFLDEDHMLVKEFRVEFVEPAREINGKVDVQNVLDSINVTEQKGLKNIINE